MTDARPAAHHKPASGFAGGTSGVGSDGEVGLPAFMAISVVLTGFSEAELLASGVGQHLFDEFGLTVGTPVRDAFLAASLPPAKLLASKLHGPLACNLIRMWYLGQWKRLPPDWVRCLPQECLEKFDKFGRNVDRVVSAQAYREGLAWTAIGANPPAAKQPGFGSWTEPPR